ncbi:MAG TPA: hypothetical protein VD861_00820 [Pyrinomonadaceae bacterium]|nr:hypothetical protein [Pyrinomonadaceae bacterium]
MATMARVGPGVPGRTFAPLGVKSLNSPATRVARFGRLQDCRVYALPFIADVTTTEACDDNIPDSSTMEVYGHPELTLHWTGGINDIPAPYNPGWFTFLGQTCNCCGGFTQCTDGRCVPRGVSCEQHPV